MPDLLKKQHHMEYNQNQWLMKFKISSSLAKTVQYIKNV